MTTVVQAASSDAMVTELSPTKNSAGTTSMFVGSPGGVDRIGFLYFNRPFPLGVKIVSAVLRLYQRQASTGGERAIEVRRVAAPGWKESTITYNNRPTFDGGATSLSQDNGAAGTVWAFNVAAQMQAVSNGAAWYGFRVASDFNGLTLFNSREATDLQPVLEVEWSDAPDAPQELSPANGRAVAPARPTFTFDFTDITGGDALTGFQLQLSTTPSETGLITDTGILDRTDPQWTPGADIPTGSLRYWRVKVRDLAGNWSAYSDWASFIRTAKPVLAITAPAAAPNDVLYEPLPTFAWTLTGETQIASQVFLTDPDDPTEVLWDSGKRSGASGSLALPKSAGVVLSPGQTYSVTVRVWGNVVREATPGDPVYVETTRSFTYGLSGSVPPVAGLSSSVVDDSPEVRLTWSRSTAPASFTVIRDGKTIAADLDPADLSTGGTGYAWSDWSASPRAAHVWKVLAVVGGIASSTSATTEEITDPTGLWLSTADGEHSVCLSGADDPVTATASEIAEVHKPPGATNPVLITQAVFGREGHVHGYLQATETTSLAEAKAEWAAITNRQLYPAGSEMFLTLTDTTMRVFIYGKVTGFEEEWVDDLTSVPVDFDYCELL